MLMPTRKTPRPAPLSICLFAVLGAGLALVLAGCGCGEDKEQEAKVAAAHAASVAANPLEYKLARLDQGAEPIDGDPTIPRFKFLLAQLAATYDRNPQAIADMTVAAGGDMRNQGTEEGVQDIMEDINQVFILPAQGKSYSTYLAAYTAAREKGISREKSVEALRSLL